MLVDDDEVFVWFGHDVEIFFVGWGLSEPVLDSGQSWILKAFGFDHDELGGGILSLGSGDDRLNINKDLPRSSTNRSRWGGDDDGGF